MIVFGKYFLAFAMSCLRSSGATLDQPTGEEASLKSAFGPDFPPESYIGVAGVDYPNYTLIPFDLHFSCYEREPGFYANPEAECQVYHQCSPDGRSYSFLCGIGTIFNQRTLTCDHWYNYDCGQAPEDYRYNLNLYVTEPFEEDNDVRVTDGPIREHP